MRGAHVVSVYWFLVIFYSVLAQGDRKVVNHGENKKLNQGESPSELPEVEKVSELPVDTEEVEENKVQRDHHTFVALLDFKAYTSPELTISFVVIGTKKMFDTGYEQYLPIERYKIHPKFKGWTADLALVYTFAAMTADKPGKVLPLAGEKVINPVDTSITVLSWGKPSERNAFQQGIISTSTRAHHGLYDDEGIHVTQMRSASSTKRHDQELYATQNNLTVEVFHFANVQTCKKIVEQSMPSIYVINMWENSAGYVEITPKNEEGKDVVCYTSDDYFIAIEDSGAPVIRYGRLFAITVGGVESEGEHVAIGMRISCYCSWIAANLPSGGHMMDCCKNCCDIVHKTAGVGRSAPKTYRGYFNDRVV